MYQSLGLRPFRATPFTEEEEKQIQNKLDKVLGPEYVSFRPGGGGQNVSYIEGWKALNLANEIFGFNGWLSELVSVQVDFMDSHGSGRVSLGLSIVVRITIKDGTYHEDIGYGFIENAKNKAMAFEKCKKEAFTDGLKRCLRCFGNVLGNCLYDRSIIAKMQKVKLPAPELENDDYHRDPLVVKREERKRRTELSRLATHTESHSHAQASVPVTTPAAAQAPQSTHRELRAVEEVSLASKLGNFDESFQFSDEINGDDESLDRIEAQQLAPSGSTESTGETDSVPQGELVNQPAEVFFTSSRKALDVQKPTDAGSAVPVFDHKFVSNTIRRTIDPSFSAKVRRADLPRPHTPSQMNRAQTASPTSAQSSGKRPLGMPPSQRHQLLKRVHRDDDKENSTA